MRSAPLLFVLLALPASAQTTTCTPLYGGGFQCSTPVAPAPVPGPDFRLLQPQTMQPWQAYEAGRRNRDITAEIGQLNQRRIERERAEEDLLADAEKRWGDGALLTRAAKGDCVLPMRMAAGGLLDPSTKAAIEKLCP